jgi:hypothetical protein
MGIQAFTPMGNTVTFTAATTAPTPVQALSTTIGGTQYRVINDGTVTVFMGWGDSAAAANANAVIVSTTGRAFPLLAGTDEILTFNANQYFTAVTASGTANIYITPGDGM